MNAKKAWGVAAVVIVATVGLAGFAYGYSQGVVTNADETGFECVLRFSSLSYGAPCVVGTTRCECPATEITNKYVFKSRAPPLEAFSRGLLGGVLTPVKAVEDVGLEIVRTINVVKRTWAQPPRLARKAANASECVCKPRLIGPGPVPITPGNRVVSND